MNIALFLAGSLAFVVGLLHSFLGERFIFAPYRARGKDSNLGGYPLGNARVRIIRATWHTATAMGWGMAAILIWWSLAPRPQELPRVAGLSIAAAMLASSVLVFAGTRGKHPGWLGLLGVAALTGIGLV